MSQRASHTPIELPFNQPKPSRKTRKNSQKNSLRRKNGRNLGRSNSERDPSLQRRLVGEKSRTQAKHSHTVSMGFGKKFEWQNAFKCKYTSQILTQIFRQTILSKSFCKNVLILLCPLLSYAPELGISFAVCCKP